VRCSTQSYTPRLQNSRAESAKREKEKEFRGERMVERARIGGSQTRVLMDTGADVSVVGRNFLERREVTVLEVEETSQKLICASQNVMEPIGCCKMEVQLKSGETAQVGFYILNESLQEIILGMNALEALSVPWVRKRVREKEKEKDHSGDKRWRRANNSRQDFARRGFDKGAWAKNARSIQRESEAMKARYGERDKAVMRSPGVGGRVSGYSHRDMNWRKRENTVVPKAYEPQAHNRRKEKSERV